jgi:hypothetical protein
MISPSSSKLGDMTTRASHFPWSPQSFRAREVATMEARMVMNSTQNQGDQETLGLAEKVLHHPAASGSSLF